MNKPEGPRIACLAWGRIDVCVNSQAFTYRDCKIWPGGAEAWDWNATGTRHHPGIRPAAVEEILERGAEMIVLGCGFHGALGVCPETEEMLRARGVEFYAAETPRAVERFNELADQGKRVGGLFHSTC